VAFRLGDGIMMKCTSTWFVVYLESIIEIAWVVRTCLITRHARHEPPARILQILNRKVSLKQAVLLD
jgi:hypothetical protein